MPWWGWVVIGWAAVSLVVGLLLGLVAARARRRERAARAYRLTHPPDETDLDGRALGDDSSSPLPPPRRAPDSDPSRDRRGA